MESLLKIVLLCILFFSPHLLTAQIVNIEDKRVERRDTAGWFGHVDLGFNLVNNGSEVITLNGGLRIEWLKNRHSFLSLSKYNLVKAEGTEFINDGFQHLRYNYAVKRWLTWEAFLQAQYNEKLNLRFRGLIGTGPRFQMVREKKLKAYLGLLYMFEHNEETKPDTTLEDHRLSAYLSFRFQPLPSISIASITYYQPVIDDVKDLRLSSETSLTVFLTQRLRFRTAFSITYDSRVPPEVANTIYRLVNGLRWEF